MLPDDPRHGQYSGAVAHWKTGIDLCDPCRRAATRTRKANALANLSGRPKMVELGDRAWNMICTEPRNQMVAKTGMPHSQLRRLELGGPNRRIHRGTRDRILNAATTWTAIGIQRRLCALSALGWSMRALADYADVDRTSLTKLRARTDIKHVRIHFAEAIISAYEDLSMQLPPAGMSAAETRGEARRRGYLPPLAWDDIDDPTERPLVGTNHRRRDDIDHAVVERFLCGEHSLKTTPAERRQITHRWPGSLADLERITGWATWRYVTREDGAA